VPTILLIRHGENDFVKKQRLAGRLPGVHLNERGRQQAAALAEALSTTPLRAVYSSPLERALETAQPLAAAHKLRVMRRPALVETNVGEWEGKRLAAVRRNKSWRILQNHPSQFRFPGGESMLEQQARLVGEVQTLCALHKPKDTIACVGHADPLKLVIAYYLGLPLDQFQRIAIDTGSVSTLQIHDGGAMLVRSNWRPAK
jgi:probable phosphoglycerate mutase